MIDLRDLRVDEASDRWGVTARRITHIPSGAVVTSERPKGGKIEKRDAMIVRLEALITTPA